MSYKILLVAATSAEAEPVGTIPGIRITTAGYRLDEFRISVLVAGVGSVSTAWEMHKWISMNEKPDLAVNLGIAGSYRQELKIGDVSMPVTDCFADAGIEDADGFLTLSEAGLTGANDFPFKAGLISAEPELAGKLKGLVKPVRAITVNTATGTIATREKLVGKYDPDIETMEGATFFYICARGGIPFFALRAVSNMVEIRNKDNWNIKLALANLADKLNEVFLTLKR